MHLAVLLKEVVANLDPKEGDTILDATVGGGGHAIEILKRITPNGKLIAIDKDVEAIERAKMNLIDFQKNITFVNDDFRNLNNILAAENIEEIDGALFDLGLSSYQLDNPMRGFSYLKNGPLDMRFNTHGQSPSAWDVVNRFKEEALSKIIASYGEERYARLIARAIVEARKKEEIENTNKLCDIIIKTVGRKYRRERIHPACRTFQALRIYVNDELGAVKEGVSEAISHLSKHSRICVISFHSLEDRIIKNIFRTMGREGTLEIITKKPITSSREEVKRNMRSRSAKMRVAQKG